MTPTTEQLIDALCVLAIPPTENGYQKQLYREASDLISKKVHILRLLKEKEMIEFQISTHLEYL